MIITSFAIPKFTTITYNSNFSKLKSDFTLIQNGINEVKTKNILLSNDITLENLDESLSDEIGKELFSKVINFPIISTNTKEKKSGKWAKISMSTYEFYLSSDKVVIFSFEDENIICKSDEKICKELQ